MMMRFVMSMGNITKNLLTRSRVSDYKKMNCGKSRNQQLNLLSNSRLLSMLSLAMTKAEKANRFYYEQCVMINNVLQ